MKEKVEEEEGEAVRGGMKQLEGGEGEEIVEEDGR